MFVSFFNRKRFEQFMTVLFTVSALFVACNLIYSAWCAFTWSKFTLFDYGIYSGMIWNSAHGEPFKVLVNDTYLSTHLSFSLGLLGLFYWIIDHPFLLSVLQWGMVLGGGGFIFAAARKARVPAVLTAALLFFWIGYRLTQGVVLSEFHGVSAYFLLVPWLYYTCVYSRKYVWVPFVLLLGVREEAFILVLPMMLYFSVRDRWKMGFIYCALAVAYGAVAIFCLYPLINGISLFDRRSSELKLVVEGAMDRKMLSVYLTFIPVAVFACRKILPALIFPSAAFLTVMLSGYPTQQGMGSHYGANVMACLGVGLLEVAMLSEGSSVSRHRISSLLRAIALVTVTTLLHLHSGFVWGGAKNGAIYRSPHVRGRIAMHAVKNIPRDGILVTDHALVAFCANRSDLLTWGRLNETRNEYDLFFSEAKNLRDRLDGDVVRQIKSGEFGVRFFDGEFVVCEKGYSTELNKSVLGALEHGVMRLVLTPKHGGKDLRLKGGRWVRYWCGKGYRTPITLSYGGRRFLNAGKYKAVLRYKAESPRRLCRNSWGEFSVHILDAPGDPLADVDIPEHEAAEGEWLSVDVPFDLPVSTNVEVRVTGGDAELWIDSAGYIAD